MGDASHQSFERFTGPTVSGKSSALPSDPAEASDLNASTPIGVVLEISGSGSQVAFDRQRMNECMDDEDPSIALSGPVGSQITIRVGDAWLLANVRNQRKAVPDVRQETDGIIDSLRKLDKDVRARRDLGTGNMRSHPEDK